MQGLALAAVSLKCYTQRNVDRLMDKRTEIRTPMLHPATSRCDKNHTAKLNTILTHRIQIDRPL